MFSLLGSRQPCSDVSLQLVPCCWFEETGLVYLPYKFTHLWRYTLADAVLSKKISTLFKIVAKFVSKLELIQIWARGI